MRKFIESYYQSGKDYGKEYQSDNARYGNAPSNFKNENILCAIVSLLKELDEKGLEYVKDDVEKRLCKGFLFFGMYNEFQQLYA